MHVHELQNMEYCKLGFSWEYTHLNTCCFIFGGGGGFWFGLQHLVDLSLYIDKK